VRNENKRGEKLVIPVHGSSVKPGTLGDILKKAGLSADEVKRLL